VFHGTYDFDCLHHSIQIKHVFDAGSSREEWGRSLVADDVRRRTPLGSRAAYPPRYLGTYYFNEFRILFSLWWCIQPKLNKVDWDERITAKPNLVRERITVSAAGIGCRQLCGGGGTGE